MRKLIWLLAMLGAGSAWAGGSSLPPSMAAMMNGQNAAPADSGAKPAASIDCRNLGVNLDGMAYFSGSEPFIDLAATAEAWHRPWGSKFDKQPIKINRDGYPVDVAPDTSASSMVNIFQWTKVLPTEPYVLTWKGTGNIDINGPINIISKSAHRIVFTLKPPIGKFWLVTSPNGGADIISDVHIVPESMQGTKEIFDKKYIAEIGRFKTLRFMDWGETNGNPLQHWVDRTTPHSYTQASDYGASYEYMLALANQLNDNLWVNIPAMVDDDYIHQMAHLFHANMKPGQVVYVEYSNEVWNWGFPQATYAHKMGVAAGYPRDGLDFYSEQVAKIAAIWHDEFKDKYAGYGPKVVVIMAGQEANPWILQQEMDFNNNGAKVDAASVAFYFLGNKTFNANNAAQWRNATPQQLAQAGIADLPALDVVIKANLAAAQKYNKPLFFYEGGQGLVAVGKEPDGTFMGNDVPIMNLMMNVNNDKSMGDVYKAALQDWQTKLGGGLFMIFNLNGAYTKWGYWGLQDGEAATFSNSPKLQAVYQSCGW